MNVVVLAVLNGEQAQTKVRVREGDTIVIGRDTRCGLCIDNPNISRLHCILSYKEGSIWLEDKKSSNGTYVNNVKITVTSLLLGDIIQLGSIFVQVVEDDAQSAEIADVKGQPAKAEPADAHKGPSEKTKREQGPLAREETAKVEPADAHKGSVEKNKQETAAKEETAKDKSKQDDSTKKTHHRPTKSFAIRRDPKTVSTEKNGEEQHAAEKPKTVPDAAENRSLSDRLKTDSYQTVIGDQPVLPPEVSKAYGDAVAANDMTKAANYENAKTIIVASGSPQVRHNLKKRLEQEKFTVIEVENGDQALDRALECRPCLIIAEDEMAVMDGWSMCANIKRYDEIKDVPVLLISSFSDLNQRIKNVALETVDFIAKPAQPEEVVARAYMSIKKVEVAKYTQKIQRWPSLDGDISQFPITDLVQSFAFTQRTGTLNIHRETGEEGFLFFDQGNIINAKLNKMCGKKALLRILPWKDGKFHLDTKPPSCSQEIFGDSLSILLDGMRVVEELQNLQNCLPPPQQILKIDFCKDFFQWGLSEAKPQQVKLVSLIHIYRTVEEIILNSEMDDLSVMNGISDLIDKGFVR